MRTNTITRTIAGGVLLVMVATGVACSKSASAFDSPYCDAAREYAVYGFTHHGDGTPAAAKAENDAYMAFVDKGVRLAPKSLRADWTVYRHGAVDQTNLMTKYGFDESRFDKEASETEKAAMHEGDPKVDAAYKKIIKYEAFTCGSSQPPAADISFEGQKPGPYCEVVAKDTEAHNSVDFGDPASVRALLTDPAAKKAGAEIDAQLIATAPKAIRDDVRANVKWWNEKQKPVQAKYGYDMAKLIRTGSAKEVAELQLTDEKIRDHYARSLAYEQQVCGQ